MTCPIQHPTCLYFFCSHQKKVIVNEVISILIQCLQLASIQGIFSCIQHLYIKRKTTKKFNFELLCLFYRPVQQCFKGSRRFFFFFMTVMSQDTIKGSNITIKKCSSIFDTYILKENLLLIVSHNIYGIALLMMKKLNDSNSL